MKMALLLSVMFSASAFAAIAPIQKNKVLLECGEAGDEAGLESLNIGVNSKLQTVAEVTISGPGDAISSFSFLVKEKLPTAVGGSIVYQDSNKKFSLSFCGTCAPMNKQGARHASVTFTIPKNSQVFPGVSQTYKEVSCIEHVIAE